MCFTVIHPTVVEKCHLKHKKPKNFTKVNRIHSLEIHTISENTKIHILKG